jgi:predicted RNase H-like HicB family nuclease
MKKITLNAKIPVSIFKENELFVAYSPVLDLSTCGKTFEEVKKRFNEIVSLFFEEIIKKDTVDEVLQNMGWRKTQKKWTPPLIVSQESSEIHIPLSV